jgi:hypothetical protein
MTARRQVNLIAKCSRARQFAITPAGADEEGTLRVALAPDYHANRGVRQRCRYSIEGGTTRA